MGEELSTTFPSKNYINCILKQQIEDVILRNFLVNSLARQSLNAEGIWNIIRHSVMNWATKNRDDEKILDKVQLLLQNDSIGWVKSLLSDEPELLRETMIHQRKFVREEYLTKK